MKAIKAKDTGIEIALRRELWERGIRYQKNCRDVYGKPDIVFRGRKVAVFCDSEFWHGYDWNERKEKIGTNREYWIPKIERNMERDRQVDTELRSQGYTVIRFWGRDIKRNVTLCADEIECILSRK